MNCKPGDMAICVRGYIDDRNVGKIVEVLRPARVLLGEQADGWVCRERDGSVGNYQDYRLLPISGIPDEEAVTREEPVTA